MRHHAAFIVSTCHRQLNVSLPVVVSSTRCLKAANGEAKRGTNLRGEIRDGRAEDCKSQHFLAVCTYRVVEKLGVSSVGGATKMPRIVLLRSYSLL